MSSLFNEPDESLGTTIDRSVTKLGDLEEVVNRLHRELPSLKKQVERFKTERASLQTEVTSLRSERDSLRIEVDYEHDQNIYLQEITISTEYANEQGQGGGAGRLNRRIWVLEQKNEDLERELEAQKVKYQEDVEKERGVSGGLRDRIGTLEEKRKKVVSALEEVEGRETGLKGELEALRASSRADIARLERELEEARASTANTAVKAASSTLRPQLLAAELADVAPSSPRRALQKRPSNLSHLPTTPTKPSSAVSHPSSTKRKRTTSLSPTSLSKRYTMLEDRFTLLKAEYDKLRSKYQDDIKHWKDWKAADTARREEKRKRKEMRKDASGVPAGIETVTLVPPSQESLGGGSQAGSQSQRVTRSQAKKRKADDEERCSQSERQVGMVSETVPPKAITTPTIKPPAVRFEPTVHMDTETLAAESQPGFVPPPPSQKRRITRTPALPDPKPRDRSETPTPVTHAEMTPRPPISESRPRTTPAARVTPWLGGSAKILSRTTSKPFIADPDPFDVDDHGDSPMKKLGAGPSTPSLIPGVKTPLVRDRGGGDGPASSLRRNLLARNVSTTSAFGDRTRRDSTSPGPSDSTGKKRGLDMSGLSPAQVAQERKRISKMSAAEKKILYADYKGKGRYLRPDEMQTRVTDEFEIDPKQNNGLNYQYHDVQRGRIERKQMHGGDCECCNGYYEAVGPLPRYNAGPAWKDSSQHDIGDHMGMTEAQIQEHQNKVSRHRETWVRPPTPPGYWQIGFPNTQDVEEQNRKADAMVAEKEAKIRRQAAHRDSKWKKKA